MANYTTWGREGDFGGSPAVPDFLPANYSPGGNYTAPTGAALDATLTRYQLGGINAPIAVATYTPAGAYAGAIAEQLPAAPAPATGGQTVTWGTTGTSPWDTGQQGGNNYLPAGSPQQVTTPAISPNITAGSVGATAPALPGATPAPEQVYVTAAPTQQQVTTPNLATPNITAGMIGGGLPDLAGQANPTNLTPGASPAQPGGKTGGGSSGGGQSGGGSQGQPQQPQQQQKPTTQPVYISNIFQPATAGHVGQTPGGAPASSAPAGYGAAANPTGGGILGGLFSGMNANLLLGLIFGAALLYAATEDN